MQYLEFLYENLVFGPGGPETRVLKEVVSGKETLIKQTVDIQNLVSFPS